MYVVDVGVPFGNEDRMVNAFQVAGEIEAEVGYAASAGAGWGYRDMQFEFSTWAEAEKANATVLEVLRKYNIAVDDAMKGNAYVSLFQEIRLP